MTLNNIVDYCCQTVGDTSSDALAYARAAVRLKYKTLYDAHSWRETRRIYNITLDPVLNGAVFLPHDAEEVLYLKLSRDGVNFTRLQYRERDWIERTRGSQFSLPGSTPFYYRDENLAWPYLGPGQLTFTTSDSSPFNVFIEGKDDNGNPISESFILNAIAGPSSVTTVNSFMVVTSLAKDGGNLQIHDSATGISMGLGEASLQLVFSQFVLYPPLVWTDQFGIGIPYSIQTQVKLKADSLDNDMSVPRISHIWDALIEFTLSSLYTRAHQLSKSDSREAKAIAHIQAAVNVEKNQSESFQQVVPVIFDSGDYLVESDGIDSANPFG